MFKLSTIKNPVGTTLISSVHLVWTQGSYTIAAYVPFKGQLITCCLAVAELILVCLYEENPTAVWSGTNVYLNVPGI